MYTTEAAPDELATVPSVTSEVTFTVNAVANASAEMPEAFMVPVGAGPDDRPPLVVSVTLAGDHVTSPGPAGAKVSRTTFVPVVPPNW